MKLTAQPPARAAAALAQPRLDDPQQDMQDRAERLGIALQKVAQALRDRQHPLAYRQRREDLVHQMRRHLSHAPGVARGTQRAALARKRDQKIVSALPAPGAGEAVGEDAAFEAAAKLPLHVLRHAAAIVVPLAGERQVSLEMALHRAVQRRALGAASAVDSAAGRSLDREVHATVASGS